MNQQINKFMNGNNESTPAKRPLTLEEIEQGMMEEKKANDEPKRMTLHDLENSFLSDLERQPPQHQMNLSPVQRGNTPASNLNINNLNEFPSLSSNEFHKITKTIHETAKPTAQQSHHQKHQQFNNHQRPNYRNYQNNNNQNYNQNYNHQNNSQYYNNKPNNNQRERPNPLNPLEMIKSEQIDNRNNGYKQPYQKNYNNQRNYQRPSGYNLFPPNKSDDEYAGIMTPKDISWLRRIQHMQLEFEDPYVQDYYYVNYQTRKIAAEAKKREKANGEGVDVPQLVIPERGLRFSSNESTIGDNPRYIPPDFTGSLGKIRVANVNYPRKLLDFNNKLDKLASNSENESLEPHGRTELNRFRKLLLDIERNLTNVLRIDHENKKIAALPPEAQVPHLEERSRLCDELFTGILTTEDNKNVNFNIANIRKGCMLIFKALQVLEKPEHKTVIISDLLKLENFHHVVMQKDKTLYCLDYGEVLADAIKTIKDCDFELLLRIAESLDDASMVVKFPCGQEIIKVLINQYTYFNLRDNENQKLLWLAFLERVREDVEYIHELSKLCNDHILALTNQ